MIEYLTHKSFDLYGEISEGDFEHTCSVFALENLSITPLFISSSVAHSYMSIDDSLSIISPVEGLPLLCVSLDSGFKDAHFFLIDKTICLRKGVFYNVLTLYGTCSLLIGRNGSSSINERTLAHEISPFGTYPKFEINKIYTIFHQEKENGFIFKGERHAFWELTFVDKGVLQNLVDEKQYSINTNEATFYSKNQHHIQWSEKGAEVAFITITFDMQFEDSKYLTDRVFRIDDDLSTILKKIVNENQYNSYYSEELIICYLKEFIIKLIRNERFETTLHELDLNIKHKIEGSITSKAIEYIEENISTRISISDIAKSVHVSQSYLSSIFKKNTNMTIVDYINKYRLEKSKSLIKTCRYTFTEISGMLGFTSIHYFSRQFKAYFGISPTEYRRK